MNEWIAVKGGHFDYSPPGDKQPIYATVRHRWSLDTVLITSPPTFLLHIITSPFHQFTYLFYMTLLFQRSTWWWRSFKQFRFFRFCRILPHGQNCTAKYHRSRYWFRGGRLINRNRALALHVCCLPSEWKLSFVYLLFATSVIFPPFVYEIFANHAEVASYCVRIRNSRDLHKVWSLRCRNLTYLSYETCTAPSNNTWRKLRFPATQRRLHCVFISSDKHVFTCKIEYHLQNCVIMHFVD
jgi:hypothetical protein